MATQNDSKKDTIYIDVDDEITAIIEKLRNSPSKIVALVLPKRAAVLQSIVNMKLLKRSADSAKKNLVLITSEAGLLPLAGAVGVFVASSLNSKPAIPPGPNVGSGKTSEPDGVLSVAAADAAGTNEGGSSEAEELDDEINDFDADAEASKPVGQLANKYSEPETIQLDNAEPAPVARASAAAATPTKPRKGKDKKLKVPNFNKFRLILILAIVGVLLLIGGIVWANTALPKAQISLKTNSSDVDTKETIIMDPKATEFDPASNVVPAKIATKQQTGSQQVSTSGQKNTGEKASGEVTMTAKMCAPNIGTPAAIASGTGVSTGGKTYITTSATTFHINGASGSCVNYVSDGSTDVVAQSAGAAYNVDGATFAVAGRSEVEANGSVSGGTDNIVKVVAQADIDSAKSKISSSDNSGVKSDLQQQLKSEGYTAVAASLHAGDPTVTNSVNVGDVADAVTVTQVTTYTMYGVKTSDIKLVVTASVNKQIDTTKQQIIKNGASSAKYQITNTAASGPMQATMTAISLAGPDIQTAALKKQFAGKKTGDIKTITRSIPGVSDVEVKYSPFWVNAVPNNTDRITIVIVKADGGTTSADD